MGHHILMGRKTYESIGRPLPGRANIVLTRSKDYAPAGVTVARSLKEALQAVDPSEEELFIIGGSHIYRQTLAQADRLYLTLVEGEFSGDTYFPELDLKSWKLVSEEYRPADDVNPHDCRFQIFDRGR